MRLRRLGALVGLLLFGLVGLPASAAPPAPIRSSVQAYFFGDSLMNGTGSHPLRPVMARVAAAQLGWQVKVDAWGGTGYTTTGIAPSYLERLQRPGALAGNYDLVLVEGGTNDARIRSTPQQVRAAVRKVVAFVRERQPRAQVVLMGAYDPPPPGRVDPYRTVVDGVIAQVAAEQGLPFFSPLSAGWTLGQPASFLNPDRLHPNAYGYGVMGSRLAAALSGLLAATPRSASRAA